MYSQTVTLTNANTNYNLLSLILNSLGYSPASLIAPPMIQVKFDNSLPFWPNPVKEFHYRGDTGNQAGVILINNSSGNEGDSVIAGQSNTIRTSTDSIDLSTYYVNSVTVGVKLNVFVEN